MPSGLPLAPGPAGQPVHPTSLEPVCRPAAEGHLESAGAEWGSDAFASVVAALPPAIGLAISPHASGRHRPPRPLRRSPAVALHRLLASWISRRRDFTGPSSSDASGPGVPSAAYRRFDLGVIGRTAGPDGPAKARRASRARAAANHPDRSGSETYALAILLGVIDFPGSCSFLT
ncbi:MAG: hypothetical protein MZV70_69185 [Desulfobacterales bacterium]|nr:hypothetical protein [Desulfobacterales bacterium]